MRLVYDNLTLAPTAGPEGHWGPLVQIARWARLVVAVLVLVVIRVWWCLMCGRLILTVVILVVIRDVCRLLLILLCGCLLLPREERDGLQSTPEVMKFPDSLSAGGAFAQGIF
jgi:hypothetical protein